MKVVAIIPARYASTRFPGKPLADINGKIMIRRVYEQVQLCTAVTDVLVATDDQRIFDAVENFGGRVVMTGEHQSGTDRCFVAYSHYGESADVIINVQGDEPFIQPGQIESLISLFRDSSVQIATLVKKITQTDDLFNPNKVKCVRNLSGNALYFSRHPVPYQKNYAESEWLKHHTYFKHIGMYAFRPDVLKELVYLPVSQLEKTESLEQLRWLENGFRISTEITDMEALAVDTPEDLQHLLSTLKNLH